MLKRAFAPHRAFRKAICGICAKACPVQCITLGENLLRVQPPLNISEENLHKAFTILDESLTELEKGEIPDGVFDYRHGW